MRNDKSINGGKGQPQGENKMKIIIRNIIIPDKKGYWYFKFPKDAIEKEFCKCIEEQLW